MFCVGIKTQTEGVRAVKKELPDPAIIYKMEKLCSLFFLKVHIPKMIWSSSCFVPALMLPRQLNELFTQRDVVKACNR